MKKLLLTGIAALLLATGTAHANENFYVQCGRKVVNVFGHHGFSFSEVVNGKEGRELPVRAFRLDRDHNVYFRGRKCFCIPWEGADRCAVPGNGHSACANVRNAGYRTLPRLQRPNGIGL